MPHQQGCGDCIGARPPARYCALLEWRRTSSASRTDQTARRIPHLCDLSQDAFYAYAEASGGEALKGARSKAVWSKPGLADTVKFLRGEDHLRHATLKAARPIDFKQALNRQLEQREAVREMLDRLKGTRE